MQILNQLSTLPQSIWQPLNLMSLSKTKKLPRHCCSTIPHQDRPQIPRLRKTRTAQPELAATTHLHNCSQQPHHDLNRKHRRPSTQTNRPNRPHLLLKKPNGSLLFLPQSRRQKLLRSTSTMFQHKTRRWIPASTSTPAGSHPAWSCRECSTVSRAKQRLM